MVLNFCSLDRPRTTFMRQDVLIKVLGAVDLVHNLAQTFRSIRRRIFQRTNAKTFSEQMSLVECSCHIC